MKIITRIAVVSLLVLNCAGRVDASTFLQFTQITFDSPFIISPGSIVATDVAVNVTFDPSFCTSVGCNGLTNGTYTFNFSATPTSGQSIVGGVLTQNFAGSLSFTSGLMNLLTVNFSDELSGSVGGSNPTLNSSEPPDSFSGSSDVFNPLFLGTPRGFSLSFSNWSPAYGNSFAFADATGTFNASPVVPESSTLFLVSLGLVIGFIVSRRRRACGSHPL